jgi:hypothetical protein
MFFFCMTCVKTCWWERQRDAVESLAPWIGHWWSIFFACVFFPSFFFGGKFQPAPFSSPGVPFTSTGVQSTKIDYDPVPNEWERKSYERQALNGYQHRAFGRLQAFASQQKFSLNIDMGLYRTYLDWIERHSFFFSSSTIMCQFWTPSFFSSVEFPFGLTWKHVNFLAVVRCILKLSAVFGWLNRPMQQCNKQLMLLRFIVRSTLPRFRTIS